MDFDIRLLAVANFTLQALLVVALLAAAYLGKKKIHLKAHCMVVRIVVGAQITSVLAVMLPAMRGYLGQESSPGFLNAEIIAHHSLGLGAIILALLVNILMVRRPPLVRRAVPLMRVSLILWLVSFALGVHLGWSIWGWK